MKNQDTLGLVIEAWIESTEKRAEHLAQRAAELKTSDWSIIDGLAEYFALKDVLSVVKANVAYHAAGKIEFPEMVAEINKEASKYLLIMARRGGSSSGGSNLIDMAKLKQWSDLAETSSYWVAHVNK